MRHRNQYPAVILICAILILATPGQIRAWIGLELDAKATGVADPYGATGSKSSGSLWEFSGRVMLQQSMGPLDAEIHWLAQSNHRAGDITSPLMPPGSPFRYLDLEAVHSQKDRSILLSELDRLSLTWSNPGFSLTVGRQAVSWGEAFYFNIGDLFGAFPVTETNRRYKPGIDAVAASVELGTFSGLSLVTVPAEDQKDSIAGHLLLPLGQGTLSFTGGRILEEDKVGSGYTVDIAGTQVYGSFLLTQAIDGDDYSLAAAGFQRQVGPYTLLTGEIYRNGWSSGDPDDYPLLILTEEYLSGEVLTLGRYNAALQVSRQISPLVTLTPAIFANFSDGSALLRMDGALSVSDLTDMTGGLFIGMGKRPDDGIPRSEYGGIPISIYVEIVHNI